MFALIVVASSSTVISSKSWVKWVSQNSPWKLTEDQFGQFWRHWWWLFVKGWHVTEFAIVTVFAAWSLSRLGWRQLSKILKWSALVGFLFACSDEIHQLFIPKRGGRVTDVMIDCGGVVIGLLLATLFLRKRLVARINHAEAKRTSSTATPESGSGPGGQDPGT